MLHFVAFMLTASHITAPPGDKQALTRLEKGLGTLSDKKAWFVRFEKQCPASETATWQRLQHKVPVNSKHYGELSFALAYYGVDYDANLRRVTRPNRFFSKDYAAYQKEYGPVNWEEQWTGWGDPWFALNLLYLKRHDIKSLGLWLDQALDGAPAEGSEDTLGELWKRHKVDILRAAQDSNQRLNSLADALAFSSASDNLQNDKKEERILLAEIDGLEQANDPRVVRAARKLHSKVKQAVDQRIRQEEGWKRNK